MIGCKVKTVDDGIIYHGVHNKVLIVVGYVIKNDLGILYSCRYDSDLINLYDYEIMKV